jgi:FAD/FMN-containing dehydrogenase
MHLYPIDGAVHRVPRDATAWSTRDAKWSMVIAGVDPDPTQAGTTKRWAREYWSAIQEIDPGPGYLNFMMEDEGDARVKTLHGTNYKRLQQVKAKYDPANLFRVNQNIAPAE